MNIFDIGIGFQVVVIIKYHAWDGIALYSVVGWYTLLPGLGLAHAAYYARNVIYFY